MESFLGFRVFTREHRLIGIISLGDQIVKLIRNMLSQLNAIHELANQGRNVTRGRIHLASFPSVTSTLLPGLLCDVKRLHLCIDVILLEDLTKKLKSGLPQTPSNLGWS